jgi:hypothetical protein
LVAVLAGCRPPDVGQFVGTWQLSGLYAVQVGEGPTLRRFNGTSPVPFKGISVELKPGEGGGLVSVDSQGCRLRWRVAGHDATLESGQTCTTSGRRAATLAMTAGSVSLQVNAPGRLLIRGQVEGTLSQGGALVGTTQPVTARVDGALTLERASVNPKP